MISPKKKTPPLFDSPSKYGIHHSVGVFAPTEKRFQWQNTSNPTDALYALPTTIGTGPKKSFGTSTREDWNVNRKKNEDCAGPGSYKAINSCGRQPSSMCRNASVIAFENAPRAPLQNDTTPSPGPIYDLPRSIGTAMSPKFGSSQRMPLYGKAEGPGPNVMLKGAFVRVREGVAPSFGTETRMRPQSSSLSAGSPGPIYDVSATGFHTGSTVSFSKSKRF